MQAALALRGASPRSEDQPAVDDAVAAGQKAEAQDADAARETWLQDRFRQASVAFRFSQVKKMCRRLRAWMASLRNRVTMEMKIVALKEMKALDTRSREDDDIGRWTVAR